MKVTKKMLNERNIHNPYNLARAANSGFFIDYIPADSGRLTSHYARWEFNNLRDKKHLKLTVLDRADKPIKLLQIMDFAKRKYGIIEWERTPFGDYQIKGTIEKVMK